MKATLILMVLFALQLHAGVNAQEARLSMKFERATAKEIINEIKRNTGYSFVYSDVDVAGVVCENVDFKDATVEEILSYCLKGTGLVFSIEENTIVIHRAAPQAQQQVKGVTVRGKVVDKKGLLLPGVTVLIKGTTIGTATNNKGEFTLDIPERDSVTLVFSFVGMKTHTEVVSELKPDMAPLTITMEEEAETLDDVVVTGYQTIDKRHLTSAVTTVKMEDIAIPGVNRIDAMLEGRIPGLTFMQNTGQVGAAPKLRIRGTSTILGSQEPVWVVDGIVVQDPVDIDPQQLNDLDFVNLLGNAISGLNPNDIERIDVLKDAAATALYGAQAANGVIVITTKRGKVGKLSVSYSFSGTFTQRPRYTDRGMNMMNSKERVEVSRELMEMGVRYTGVYDNFSDWIGYERAYIDYFTEGNISYDEFVRQAQWYETMNTDWLDILTDDVFSNSHTLSINGGSNEFSYYFSLGYANEQGNVINEENKRYTTYMKLSLNYPKLSGQFSFNGSVTNKAYAPEELNVMSYAYSMSRAIPLRDQEGELWYYKKNGYPFNIINDMENSSRTIDQYTASITGQIAYRFTEAFRLTGTASYNFGYTNQELWFGENSNKVTVMRGAGGIMSECPFGGVLTTDNTTHTSYTLRLQADYSKYLTDRRHFFNVMAGYELTSDRSEARSEEERGYYADRGNTFVENMIPSLSMDLNELQNYPYYYRWKVNNNPTLTNSKNNSMSAYLTFTYSYDDRYILNFNARADWSNTFGSRSNEKLLPVWSVSGRWNISNDVLKNATWVDNLALRLSYGLQGNIVNGQPNRLVINKGAYDATLGGYVSTINAYPNPDLKWEKNYNLNIGLDLSFINRIYLTVEYYNRDTKDLLYDMPISATTGFLSYLANVGQLNNRGVEVELRTLNFTGRNFSWTTVLNLSHNENKIVNLNGIIDQSIEGTWFIRKVGLPFNTLYVKEYAGVDPENGKAMYYKNTEMEDGSYDRSLTYDHNEAQAIPYKTVDPVLTGGLTNILNYRWFDLSFTFTFSLGGWSFDKTGTYIENGTTKIYDSRYNLPVYVTDAWRQPGDVTDVPRFVYGEADGPQNSSRYVHSTDHLRLKNLTFGYTFPRKLTRKAMIEKARLYFSGSNLLTWAAWKQYDPEVPVNGEVFCETPIMRTFSFGLQMTF